MIGEMFNATRRRGESALIPYLTAGFPSLGESMDLLRVVADSGADAVEIGIPFCDPVADGPTIQRSSQHALDNGVRLSDILDALGAVDLPIPKIVMSYLNPLLSHGRQRVLERMAQAGVSGLIVPDLPLEEADPWIDLDDGLPRLAFLVAPTTPEQRILQIVERSKDFIYYVSVTGVTGVRHAIPSQLHASLRRLRRLTDRPLAVGFGIGSAEQIRTLRGLADGVVVGSRIIEAIRDEEQLSELIRELKRGTKPDEARSGEPC